MVTEHELQAALAEVIETVALPELGAAMSGKVREAWRLPGGKRVLVTTDRVSAFDRVLGTIPCKGQVLNQLSAWWFGRTRGIVGNHMIAVPDANTMIVRDAEPLPVEVSCAGS